MNMSEELEALAKQIGKCQLCGLGRSRTNAVPGEGPATAHIMFIGEAPGYHEDQQGRPFVGASGKFLDELLASMGMRREQVYIANVIKCRPPQNRDPLPEEIATCKSYLDQQIALVKPAVIVTLGRFSMARYFPDQSISRIHGQAKKIGSTLYVPMFHPAAALHQPKYRSLIEEDFARLPALLARLQGAEKPAESPPPPEEKVEQLSLF
jgi:uracil-DNA glycosylase